MRQKTHKRERHARRVYPTKTLPESTCGAHRVRKHFALTADRPTHVPWRPEPSDFSASIFPNSIFLLCSPVPPSSSPLLPLRRGPLSCCSQALVTLCAPLNWPQLQFSSCKRARFFLWPHCLFSKFFFPFTLSLGHASRYHLEPVPPPWFCMAQANGVMYISVYTAHCAAYSTGINSSALSHSHIQHMHGHGRPGLAVHQQHGGHARRRQPLARRRALPSPPRAPLLLAASSISLCPCLPLCVPVERAQRQGILSDQAPPREMQISLTTLEYRVSETWAGSGGGGRVR